MRTIEVRAWDQERKVMVYGQDIEEFTEECDEISYTVDVPRYQAGLSYGKLFVAYTGCNTGEFTECEVMESTDTKDQNGKTIFEGDVLKCSRYLGTPGQFARFIGAVEYDDWWGAFRIKGVKQYQGLSAELRSHPREIIGNIYENPELLSVSDRNPKGRDYRRGAKPCRAAAKP